MYGEPAWDKNLRRRHGGFRLIADGPGSQADDTRLRAGLLSNGWLGTAVGTKPAALPADPSDGIPSHRSVVVVAEPLLRVGLGFEIVLLSMPGAARRKLSPRG